MILAEPTFPASLDIFLLKQSRIVMSSNLIYAPSAARIIASLQPHQHSAGDRTPYCYLIGWSSLNLWYYGRRTAKGCHPNEFWIEYFTSSVYVAEKVFLHGEPDVFQIRKIFSDFDDCIAWENSVLTRLDVEKRADFLNRRNGDSEYNLTNQLCVTHKESNKRIIISCDEFATNRHLYSHHSEGMIHTTDSMGNKFYIRNTDPRYIAGELKHSLQAGIQLVSPDGRMFVVPREDEHLYPDHRRNLEGTVFAKDSHGSIHRVSVDDPMLVSGELKCLNAGKMAVIDSEGNSYRIDCDEYYANKGTKYTTAVVGTVVVRSASGECFRIPKTDPRFVSGELKSVLCGLTTVIDTVSGKRMKISVDDPRIASGELIKSNYDKEKHNGRIKQMKSMCDRQEVIELRAAAAAAGIKLPMNWEKRKDLSVIWKLLNP